MGRTPDASSEPAPGTKLLQWRWQRTYAIPDPMLGYNTPAARSGHPHTTEGMVRDECVAEWTVEQGIATRYRWEGTACPAVIDLAKP